MRGQEEGEGEGEEDYSGTGYEDGQYYFVLYNRAVLRQETNDEITHCRSSRPITTTS